MRGREEDYRKPRAGGRYYDVDGIDTGEEVQAAEDCDVRKLLVRDATNPRGEDR